MNTKKNTILTMMLTAALALFALGTSASAEIIDPSTKEYAITAEMLDTEHADYSEGGIDLKGKAIYKYYYPQQKDTMIDMKIPHSLDFQMSGFFYAHS